MSTGGRADISAAGLGLGRNGRIVESILLHLRRSARDADRRGLQLEWLGLREAARVLDALLALLEGAVAVLSRGQRVDVARVAWRRLPAVTRSERWRAEARGVGCRLRTKLGEVQVRAGAVADCHRLPELALGPEAVEDDSVDGDNKNLDYDFDDAADKRPVLVDC